MYINKNEVLRYLGYKNNSPDDKTLDLIYECENEIKNISRPRYVYRIYDIERKNDELGLKDTVLTLKGKGIKNHLKHSSKCAVMAATLGIEVDRQLSVYSKFNLTKALIFHACATAAIENICDKAQGEIKKQAEKSGFNITGRFSPGYGDLGLEIQPEIISILEAYKNIGLTVTDSLILTPRKSVTAFVGFQEIKFENDKSKCLNCSKINCKFRSDYKIEEN